MKIRIYSPRSPQWNAQSYEMHQLLGVKRLPDEGMPERLIQGVRVYVKPIVRVKGQKSSKHRVMAICVCGQHLSVGRLHQHKCRHDSKEARVERVNNWIRTGSTSGEVLCERCGDVHDPSRQCIARNQ